MAISWLACKQVAGLAEINLPISTVFSTLLSKSLHFRLFVFSNQSQAWYLMAYISIYCYIFTDSEVFYAAMRLYAGLPCVYMLFLPSASL